MPFAIFVGTSLCAWFKRRHPRISERSFLNGSNGRVRLAMFSSASDPEVTVYPEAGEVGVFADWSRADRGEMRLGSGLSLCIPNARAAVSARAY